MAYRALYRTYRPARFEDVIGQKHVTVTLQNQIATGHVAHAYLFCGTRGTGKTSTAKIFARAVNCLSPVNGEPCGQCEACRLMLAGSTPDITEIDAASNNGVDNVRGLIEQVRFSTMQLGTRVLIIDEVHMLSGSAFNALLKTLEEPPEHTLFILATTEPQKLPATIISRCQRFDFRRISIPDIIFNLENVLKKAGVHIDDGGLQLIARSADGGMRDALSLADQCLAFCGDNVTEQDVYAVLGSMDQGFLFDFSAAILAGDTSRALRLMDQIVRNGRDLTVFTQDLAAHMRALMLANTCGRCEDLLDCTSDSMDRYIAQAKDASPAKLLMAMQALLGVQSEMRYLTYPRALLESTIVRICRPGDHVNLLALESRIDSLERELASLKANPPVARPAPQPAAAPVQAAPVPASRTAAAPTAPVNREAPQAVPPTAPAAPAAAPAVQNDNGMSADGLFNTMLAEFRKQNPFVYALLAKGSADQLTEDTLVIRFAEENTTQYNGVTAPINKKKLEDMVNTLRPGTKLSFVKGARSPLTQDTIDTAKQIFGDSLSIED